MFQRGFKPHARDKIGVSNIGWMITLRIINEFEKKLIKMVAKGVEKLIVLELLKVTLNL